jgi:hypothetical protein
VSAADEILSTFEQAATEYQHRADLEAKAQRADDLSRENLMLRVGVPDDGVGRMFAEHYSGPLDESEVRMAWAELIGDPSFLTRAERLQYDIRRARAAREETP